MHRNNHLCKHLPTYDLSGVNVTLLKKYLKSNFLDSVCMFFGFSAPRIGGVLTKTFLKPSFTHSFTKMAPGGGLPDFTRRGTNYLHTPLLKKYQKSESLDSNGMFFGFSVQKIGGVRMKTFSKPSFTHFLQKWPPGAGGFTRFHHTWH